jgi:hypothetical protein
MTHPQRSLVRFQNIEIIELAITIGNNPSVSNGCPLTVEWESQKRTVIPLKVFEKLRPPRVSLDRLKLSSRSRERLLLRSGCSLQDIHQAALETSQVRKERLQTAYSLIQMDKETTSFKQLESKEHSKSNVIVGSEKCMMMTQEHNKSNKMEIVTPPASISKSTAGPMAKILPARTA